MHHFDPHATLAALEGGVEYVPIIDVERLLILAGFRLDEEAGQWRFYLHKDERDRKKALYFNVRFPDVAPWIGPGIAAKISKYWPPR